MNHFSSKITGTGSAFPEHSMTNAELVSVLAQKGIETSDDWIRERTGIAARRISKPGNPAEHCSSLGAAAATRALEMAGRTADEIDMILFTTSTPDLLLPSSACLLQQKIKATNAWALDMNAACSGFVFALATADQFIRSGQAKVALIVGADVLSTISNWDDRGSCILFGDGAGAAIVERTPEGSHSRILSSHLRSAGDQWNLLYIPTGGSADPLTKETVGTTIARMQMKGKDLYKVAVKTLTDLATEALAANQISLDQLDWIVPHQANLRIIEGVIDRLGFPISRVVMNIDRYGNTSSATVPTALDEAVRERKITTGQTVLLDVFGAGVTSGSILMRW